MQAVVLPRFQRRCEGGRQHRIACALQHGRRSVSIGNSMGLQRATRALGAHLVCLQHSARMPACTQGAVHVHLQAGMGTLHTQCKRAQDCSPCGTTVQCALHHPLHSLP